MQMEGNIFFFFPNVEEKPYYISKQQLEPKTQHEGLCVFFEASGKQCSQMWHL